MGSVVYIDDYRKKRLERAQAYSRDDLAAICYESALRDIVKRELLLYPPIMYQPSVKITDEIWQGFGEYIDNEVACETAMRQLRELVRLWGVQPIQSIAERTVYENYLRLAIIREEGGIIAIWRRCS